METREWFARASEGFHQVLDGLEGTDLSGPGLGEWDLLALLGHTTRAWSTIGTYLTPEPTQVVLDSPQAYFSAVREGLADPVQVARRGVQAGAALGAEPLLRAREIADQGVELVNRTRDRDVVDTPVGGIRFADYLVTRALEVTTHSLDLARAADLEVPEVLARAALPAVQLVASLAPPASAVQLLRAVTGRDAWPAGSTLL